MVKVSDKNSLMIAKEIRRMLQAYHDGGLITIEQAIIVLDSTIEDLEYKLEKGVE